VVTAIAALPKVWKICVKDFERGDRLEPEIHVEWGDGGIRRSMSAVGFEALQDRLLKIRATIGPACEKGRGQLNIKIDRRIIIGNNSTLIRIYDILQYFCFRHRKQIL
jgi:hypothetical protein